MYETPWAVDPMKVLTRRELATVPASLNAKAAKSPQARMNRTVLRLACCAGLRVSEIAGQTLDDVRVVRPDRIFGFGPKSQWAATARPFRCGGTRGRSPT